ncbi:hypothetical protein [Aridibaculum aurantiacum]|uniref:hypothetical protein n=1 Tax=Aridibaculum aurantiacum TaxID=2810307 RepID=UPI001A96C837|nr:hypothetical protein [Aridibaculum aurantiacum]
MDLQPFFVELLYDNQHLIAEIKPCCQENNVIYYDISINNRYEFTITPNAGDYGFGWRIALVNADKKVDPELADLLGEQIEKHILE